MSTDDFPADTTTTGVLANGGRIAGTIDTVGDVDWIRLALDPERAYLFTARTAAGTEPIIYVIDAAAPSWPKFTNQQGLLASNDLVNPFVPDLAGSQYYLRVENPTATTYTIGMTAAADDYGNGSASARPLAVGGSADASFDYSFDHEHYLVAATAGVTYTVTITADAMAGDAWMRASNGVGNIHDASHVSEDGFQGEKTLTMSFLAKETRTYDIDVTMPSFSPPAAPVHYRIAVSAADASAPAVVSATGTFNGPIRVTFDEPIRLGSGTIRLGNDTWDVAGGAVSVEGNTLVIDAGLKLWPSNAYSLLITPDAITDLLGNHAPNGSHADVKIGGIAVGNLVAARDMYYSGETIHGTAGTLDVVLYQGARSHYTLAVADGHVDVRGVRGEHDTLAGVERLYFSEGTDAVALSLAGNLGQVYRLYQAAFDRTPDQGGLGYWLAASDGGMALAAIARQFIDSGEFGTLYGAAPSNAAFVDALYRNILHRAGDAGGVAYWNKVLAEGADRANVLVSFSESTENVAAVTIGDGFAYTLY